MPVAPFFRAWRNLRRDASPVAVAVLVLALGIGAVTAMFSVVNAVLLRPLAIADPGRVFELRAINGSRQSGIGAGDYDLLRAVPGLAASALLATNSVTLTGPEGAENLFSQKLAGAGLAVYGVRPVLGAPLDSLTDRSVVISHRLWTRRYRNDPNAAGRSITVNGEAWTLAAVMPAGFRAANAADIWLPWRLSPTDLEQHGEGSANLIARLAPGAQSAAVEAALFAAAREHQPERYKNVRLSLLSLTERQLGKPGPVLWSLLGAVGLVLLIACLNAGSILVSRGVARRREAAVRAALGASGLGLLSPLLAEAALLAGLAAAAGSALAWALIRGARLLLPVSSPLPRLEDAAIDGPALAFALLAALASIALASLAPAFSAWRVDPAAAFGDQSRASTSSRSSVRFGAVSAVLQTALSVTLLIGAGLLLRSLNNTIETDPGYQREGVLTARIPMPFDLGPKAYGDQGNVTHYNSVLAAIRVLPGVTAAGIATSLPLGRVGIQTDFVPEGRPAPRPAEYVQANAVSPDYFRVLGIPLRAGRVFDDADTATSDSVLIVNEAAARRYWPGESPLGRRVQGRKPMTVVGVVGNVRRASLREAPREEVYRPFSQFLFGLHGTTLVLRTAPGLAPESLAGAVQKALRERFPNHPVAEVRPMTGWIDDSVAGPRFYAALLTGFAFFALLIAAAGVYGMVAQVGALRRREMGIRLAVGARPAQLAGALIGRGLALVALGVALGALGSLALSALLKSQLYGVAPDDPLTLGAVGLLFALVALAAMAAPAWRAGRVDPLTVLRAE